MFQTEGVLRRLSPLLRALVVTAAAATAAACVTYPSEPRYSTRPTETAPPPIEAPAPYEPPPPIAMPTERIDGGALPPTALPPTAMPPAQPPRSGLSPRPVEPVQPPPFPPPTTRPPPPPPGAVAYVIQPGDTISGVGRRFQTPVQTLIDLNALGPRGSISSGQRIQLPNSAIDTGADPYASGPAPVGVVIPNAGTPPPPPPPPPSGNPPPPRPTPVPAPAPNLPPGAAPTSSALAFDWPVRGEIVRRFGPQGVSARNNGVNIGAASGTQVAAAADGRVAYVGDELVGQGLTILIVHADGWRTVYGHLGTAVVDDGDQVRRGQAIGTVGESAGDGRPSIHFETRRMDGDNPVAIDPVTVLPR